MNEVIKHSIRFIVLVILQSLILNQLEIGWGIQLMVYPLLIILLPFELGTIYLLAIAFVMGMVIDSISNTYGLHTSSLLLVAYLRPQIFKMFAPRDGNDNLLILQKTLLSLPLSFLICLLLQALLVSKPQER